MINKKLPEILSKEDVIEKHRFTVGQLLDFIERNNIPEDAPILVQRIEDHYYDNNHWGVYLKKGEGYHDAFSHNKQRQDLERYPYLKDSSDYTEEEIELTKDQYSPIHGPVFYKDDNDILFLDLHY